MLNDFITKNREDLERFSAMESTAHSIIESQGLGEIVHITDAEIADLKTAFHLKD